MDDGDAAIHPAEAAAIVMLILVPTLATTDSPRR